VQFFVDQVLSCMVFELFYCGVDRACLQQACAADGGWSGFDRRPAAVTSYLAKSPTQLGVDYSDCGWRDPRTLPVFYPGPRLVCVFHNRAVACNVLHQLA
jgi:hypothetical protein